VPEILLYLHRFAYNMYINFLLTIFSVCWRIPWRKWPGQKWSMGLGRLRSNGKLHKLGSAWRVGQLCSLEEQWTLGWHLLQLMGYNTSDWMWKTSLALKQEWQADRISVQDLCFIVTFLLFLFHFQIFKHLSSFFWHNFNLLCLFIFISDHTSPFFEGPKHFSYSPI